MDKTWAHHFTPETKEQWTKRGESALKKAKTIPSAGKAMLLVSWEAPDLAPSDYFLFPNLKRWLGGWRFSDNEEMEPAANDYYEELVISHYK